MKRRDFAILDDATGDEVVSGESLALLLDEFSPGVGAGRLVVVERHNYSKVELFSCDDGEEVVDKLEDKTGGRDAARP